MKIQGGSFTGKEENAEINRIMIAGTGSGCGKTTMVCGLLRALQKKGITPAAFKCGPDYIDPLYHREVLGIESRNLDSFFMTREVLLEDLKKGSENAEISIIEGVMGYYDGLGTGTRYSSAEIAELTGTPVIIILDAGGRSISAIAELRGFLQFRPEGKRIRGVIFNRLPAKLYPRMAALAEAEGVKPCGYLAKNAVKSWESRHLGLVTPSERPDFCAEADLLAERIGETVDLETVIALAKKADPVGDGACGRMTGPKAKADPEKTEAPVAAPENTTGQMQNAVRKSDPEEAPVIALARDEAFCFYYTENEEYLRSAGFCIVPFSPVHDKGLPECDGLILPGGYPENEAEALSENASMRESIREAIGKGLPTIAECGGFLYLHRELIDVKGRHYAMAGFLRQTCRYAGFQKNFGYVKLRTETDGLFGAAGEVGRGHEFHYFTSEVIEESAGTNVLCEKPDGSGSWRGGIMTASLYAGFPHLFLPGSRAGEHFMKRVREQAGRKGQSRNG